MNLYEDGKGEDAGKMVKIGMARPPAPTRQPPRLRARLAVPRRQTDTGHLHAIPLPAEKAAEARRKANQRAKDKGRKPSAEALYLSEWVLIFTSLPPEEPCTDTASELYRVRWQVELVIKRLKVCWMPMGYGRTKTQNWRNCTCMANCCTPPSWKK